MTPRSSPVERFGGRAVFGIVGDKNSGKTTLITRLVTHISASGLSVSTVKHAHHAYKIDDPGTDSDRHAVAGACEVLIGAQQRWSLLHHSSPNNDQSDDLSLEALIAHMTPVDLILVEGYKSVEHVKLRLRNPSPDNHGVADSAFCHVVATASTTRPRDHRSNTPWFDRDDIAAIAAFILSLLALEAKI